MTLLEVVLALGILGAVLTAGVTARNRFGRQAAGAARRAQAAAAADRLLSSWWEDRDHFPVSSGGTVDGTALHWRTGWTDQRLPAELGARVVRLEIFDPSTDPGDNASVLASVELLWPDALAAGSGGAP